MIKIKQGKLIETLMAGIVYIVFNIFISTLLLISQTAYAKIPEHRIDLNLTSWHSQKQFYSKDPNSTTTIARDINSKNTGIGYSYQLKEYLDISVGAYKNSYYKTSVYGGLEFHTSRDRLISAGVALAGVSGYQDTPSPTSILLLPIVQMQLPNSPTIGLRVGYMPFGDTQFGTIQLFIGI